MPANKLTSKLGDVKDVTASSTSALSTKFVISLDPKKEDDDYDFDQPSSVTSHHSPMDTGCSETEVSNDSAQPAKALETLYSDSLTEDSGFGSQNTPLEDELPPTALSKASLVPTPSDLHTPTPNDHLPQAPGKKAEATNDSISLPQSDKAAVTTVKQSLTTLPQTIAVDQSIATPPQQPLPSVEQSQPLPPVKQSLAQQPLPPVDQQPLPPMDQSLATLPQQSLPQPISDGTEQAG